MEKAEHRLALQNSSFWPEEGVAGEEDPGAKEQKETKLWMHRDIIEAEAASQPLTAAFLETWWGSGKKFGSKRLFLEGITSGKYLEQN